VAGENREDQYGAEQEDEDLLRQTLKRAAMDQRSKGGDTSPAVGQAERGRGYLPTNEGSEDFHRVSRTGTVSVDQEN